MAKKSKVVHHTASTVPKKIHDYSDPRNIGISFWNTATLQDITKKSGTLAKQNEYQVHYWALNARHVAEDGSILDLSFPLVIFNYDQEVSGAHIEFDLTDVQEVSEQLEPLVKVELNKLYPMILEHFPDLEYTYVSLNTMHRHPGGSTQSFSGTDMKHSNHTNPGIVFPLHTAKGHQPSFSHIIAHVSNKTVLAHSEYRIAVGSINDKEGLQYYNGRTATIIRGEVKTTPASIVERLFGYEDKTTNTSYIVTDDFSPTSDYFKRLQSMWDIIEYLPNIDFIFDKNLTTRSYTSTWGQPISKHSSGLPTYGAHNTSLNRYATPVKELIEAIEKEVSFKFTPRYDMTNWTLQVRQDYYKTLFIHKEGREPTEDETKVKVSACTVDSIVKLQDDIIIAYHEAQQNPKTSSTLAEEDDLVFLDNGFLDMNNAFNKKVIAAFNESVAVDSTIQFTSIADFKQLKSYELNNAYNTLYERYFGMKKHLTDDVTVEDTVFLWQKLLDEFCWQDYPLLATHNDDDLDIIIYPDVDEMTTSLAMSGISGNDLINATENDIKKWYRQLEGL